MKYPGGNPSTMFCEQVGTVTSLFEQWNDCERTVVLYALLKRLPFSNLKFLQLSIEYNIAQNYNSQSKLHLIESNSNNGVFLAKLISTYKNFKCNETQLSKDSVIYESDDSAIFVDVIGKYDKKEDILNDILTYLPLLKPGNDEAKAAYMSFVPLAVEDSVRQIVPTELVQQILSYLLIHPAVTGDDRRSLGHWLHHLEEHINSSYYSKSSGCFMLSNDTSVGTNTSNSSLWQAIVPSPSTILPITAPTPSQSHQSKHESSWDLRNDIHNIQVTSDFCDEMVLKEFRKTVGNNVEFNAVTTASSRNLSNIFDTSNDDHHISFSKNGTEILDFDCDDYDKSNTQIAFDPLTHLRDFLTVPNYLENGALKTRRSNSLTTATTQNTCSASAENLASIAQKPRSFSLSMESPHSSLTSSGSETRLDDFKPNYMKFTTHNPGMTNIGQWLKSLRLHKYVWLFSNITYEQMMDISEEYLQNLGVTKGARHKLVLCIQKLKDRFEILTQVEKSLIAGQANYATALEEMTNIVLTPMKPSDHYNKEDIADQFIKVLELVATVVISKPVTSPQDEECVNTLLWILERALHNDAFVAQINHLKEYKFKFSKIKMQFVPKGHYTKNTNTNLSKPRWNANSKLHKPNEKAHRKNSNTAQNYPINMTQHLQQYQQDSSDKKYHIGSNITIAAVNNSAPKQVQAQAPLYNSNSVSKYNKSSSYPNFSQNNKTSTASQNHPQPNSLTNTSYHRHSLNNLITAASSGPVNNCAGGGSSGCGSSSSSNSSSSSGGDGNPTNAINYQSSSLCSSAMNCKNFINKENTKPHSSTSSSSQTGNTNGSSILTQQNVNNICGNNSETIERKDSKNTKSSIGDINSRLEFLCLQMTEQAIN